MANFGLTGGKMRGLAGAVLVFVSGCATQGNQVERVSYQYTARNRVAAEARALQEAQDECYFAGRLYAQREGAPEIASVGGPEGDRFRATQSFYCFGYRGED